VGIKPVIKILIEAGADVNAKTDDGLTQFDVAGSDEIANYIEALSLDESIYSKIEYRSIEMCCSKS
jgi:hypothetical protein